jgi:transcriptional regulator with XRE-family HTH domain
MARAWDSLKKILLARGEERGFKAEFARKLGIAPQAVQRYFNPDDATVPSLDQAEKMAEALELRWELIALEDSRPAPVPKHEPTLADIAARLDRIEARMSSVSAEETRLLAAFRGLPEKAQRRTLELIELESSRDQKPGKVTG